MRRSTRFRISSHLQNCFGARRLILFACALIAALSLIPSPSHADKSQSAQQTILHLKIDSEIEPILATYLDEGIDEAARRNASLILITMDTPGGLSSSMENIVQHILNSKVPVAVYVSPTGSRAASAGFYILLSADIAAMAPGTHTGAASPVMIVGGYAMAIDETMRKKINNDALAFLRSYADKRNRNPVLAATAITDAKAFTEKEALDGKMIDVVASFRRRLAAPAQRPRNHPLRRHESHARDSRIHRAPISNSRRARNSSRASSRPTCFSFF